MNPIQRIACLPLVLVMQVVIVAVFFAGCTAAVWQWLAGKSP